MFAPIHNLAPPVLAAESGGGNFLVTPSLGLMIWTLLAFGVTLFVLRKYVFPRIQVELDKRQRMIEDSIDTAERTKKEADEILAEYRQRLQDARQQADEIVSRARTAADAHQEEVAAKARAQGDELIERNKREIDAETRRALDRIRAEVADLTVIAAEKVTRKSLDSKDHRRLVDEALQEVDFSQLAGGNGDRGDH